jgi:hypothetical protein
MLMIQVGGTPAIVDSAPRRPAGGEIKELGDGTEG